MRRNAWILKVVSLALVMVLTVGFLPPMQMMAADTDNDDGNLGISEVATPANTAAVRASDSNICYAGKTYKVTNNVPTTLFFTYYDDLTYECIKYKKDGSFVSHSDSHNSLPKWAWLETTEYVYYYTFISDDVKLSGSYSGNINIEEVNHNDIALGNCDIDWSELTVAPQFVEAEKGRYSRTGEPYIKITFDKKLRYSACDFDSIVIKNLDTNSIINTTAYLSGYSTRDYIYLDIDDRYVTNYSVSIPPDKLTDIHGNYFAGLNYDGDSDPSLQIKTLRPENNATNVPFNTSIDIEFTKPVNWIPNIGIYLKEYDSDTIVDVKMGAQSVDEASLNTINIHPIENLKTNTKYYIQISPNAIHDGDGNTPQYFAGFAKGEYVFTTGTTAYDSNKIYQYLLNQDANRLFGGYDFALYYVNDINAWNVFLYGIKNYDDIILAILQGLAINSDIADAYMNNPIKTDAILRDIVNELCNNNDLKYFSDSKKAIDFAFSVLSYEHKEVKYIWDALKATVTADEIATRWFTDYSQNIALLKSIESATSSSTLLHRSANNLMDAYIDPISGAATDMTLDDIQNKAVENLLPVIADAPTKLLLKALDLILGANKSLGGMDKVISLNTIQDESIQAFKEVSQKIKAGNYTDDDIEDYMHLFNLCKGLKLMQYKEMQKNYNSGSQESIYLQDEIDSLQNMRYDKFTYATSFIEPPKEKRFFGIFCPVDVDIYNSNGVIVAQFINDTPTYLNGGENELIVFSNGDEKFVVADSDAKLTFNLTATNSGVMDFNVRDFMMLSDGDIDSKIFNNVTLQSGKKMTVKTTEGIIASEIRLYITDENGTPIAEVAADGTETPINTPPSATSSGKSESGSSNNTASANTIIDPLANLLARIRTAVETAAKTTPADQSIKATVQIKNANKITLAMLKQATDTAKKAGGNVTLHFDTMSADGKTVLTRIYVKPEFATKDIILSANEVRAKSVKTLFEKYFINGIAVVSFDQQGSFGMPVEVATKVDLTGMDTENLFFYSYNKETNSYTRIKQPEYRIDRNGYLHFTTEYAGDIVISEDSLARK